jgi:peptide alpha-N-acetyltransferase
MSQAKPSPDEENLRYAQYELEKEHIYLDPIRQLISKDLSEPYSIYVYRYFLNQWGNLCYMVSSYIPPFSSILLTDLSALNDKTDELRGVVVCKLEEHRSGTFRGYIAMLAVVEEFRGKGIATKLVRMAIDAMKARDADEVCSALRSHSHPDDCILRLV